MNREKQIEEMTEIIIQNTEFDTMIPECAASAKAIYEAGYRKASEVAREIIDDFAEYIRDIGFSSFTTRCEVIEHLAELKKKYIGEVINVTTNTEGGE